MAIPEEAALAKEVTNAYAVLFAFILAFVGIIGAGLSPKISSAWLGATALALATTLFSIGALSLVFELGLRRSVTRELLKLTGINEGIVRERLIAAGGSRTLSWERILGERSTYRVLLFDPAGWIEQNYHLLLESGNNRPVTVSLYIPDANQPYVEELAESLGTDLAAFKASLADMAVKLERLWKAKAVDKKLRVGSQISIRLLQSRPMHSLIIVDNISVVIFTGVMGRDDADQDYSLVYSGGRLTYPAEWFERQFIRLAPSPILFENEVQS